TSGVEDATDVARYLLAGADVVMTASALLRHGPGYAGVLLEELSGWMTRKGFRTVGEVRGLLSVPAGADATDYERAGYVTALAAPTLASAPWGGPPADAPTAPARGRVHHCCPAKGRPAGRHRPPAFSGRTRSARARRFLMDDFSLSGLISRIAVRRPRRQGRKAPSGPPGPPGRRPRARARPRPVAHPAR